MNDNERRINEVKASFDTTMKHYNRPNASVGPFVVAVSGGGDSMALMRLMADWCARRNVTLLAVTVNHNLRAEAADEAAMVAKTCMALNIEHTILSWDDWDGHGNLQAMARGARRALIGEWACSKNAKTIVMGHTKDDVAENFLIRLARGSGVDGLAQMAPSRYADGLLWIRPLIDIARDDLRVYLRDLKQAWVEDPSNVDERYDRVKMRNAGPALAKLGLTSDKLSQAAAALASAREALEVMSRDAAQDLINLSDQGVFTFDRKLLNAPSEIQHRLLSNMVRFLTNNDYAPRRSSLLELISAVQNNKNFTLGGCFVAARQDGTFCMMRERNAMKPSDYLDVPYDQRWLVTGGDLMNGATIRPLGEDGLANCENWRELGQMRDTLLILPSIWRNDELIAAPIEGKKNGYNFKLTASYHDFLTFLSSH